MSRRVALVRHGAHDELGRVLSGRTRDIGLNAAGRAAVAALGVALCARDEALGAQGVAQIHTSPARRCRETAAILGRALGRAPRVAPALDEIDFGAWSGRAFAELAADPAWDLWNAARASAPTPGGETMAQAVARAARHLDALAAAGARAAGGNAAAPEAGGAAAAGAGEPIVAVSHCDIIRGVLAHYLGLSLDHILRLEVAPASVCWLEVDGRGGARVLGVNAGG